MPQFARNLLGCSVTALPAAARCRAATSSITAPSAALATAFVRLSSGLTSRLSAGRQRPCTRTSARFSSALAGGRFSTGKEKPQLVQLLEKEIEHGKEHVVPEDEKEVVDFLGKSGWKVQAKEGHADVTLSKTFGQETVDVTFSISEIEQRDNFADDMDEDEMNDGADEDVMTVHATVNCEKPGRGTLSFDVTFEQGDVFVRNASQYPSAEVAKPVNAEAEWQRRSLYAGPVFSELDEDVQNAFTQYLQERGVDNDLAVFAVRYASMGEQKEYFNWLHRVADHLRV